MQCKRCSYSDWHTTLLNFRNHGQLVGTLSGHTSWVLSVAYSPDNEHFVSSSADHTVRVWKESTRQCIHTFSEHTDQVFTIFKMAAFLFKLIFFNLPQCLIWWQQFQIFFQAWSVAYNADGSKVLSVSEDKSALVYDIPGNISSPKDI